jgi:hypothetical protein
MKISMLRRFVIPAMFLAGAALCAGPALAAKSSAELSAANQVPAVDSQGKGTADFTYDAASKKLTWTISYSGLSGPVTAAHIHTGAAGANGKVLLPLTKQGGDNASPIKGEATLTDDQAKAIMSGDTYVNVHTADHKGGEIRGQLAPPA